MLISIIATAASLIFKGFQSSLQDDNAATAQKRLEIMEKTGDAVAQSQQARKVIASYVPQWTTATDSVSTGMKVLAAAGILIAIVVVIISMRRN